MPPGDAGRLRRVAPGVGGIRRRRCGHGFRYLGAGEPVTDERTLARIRALVIPPAWQDVWICADPAGHIQATGTDAAGRRQYLYHPRWREQRDQDKHDRVMALGVVLPQVREKVSRHLDGRGLTRDRVLAAVGLAVSERADTDAARKRAVARVVSEVAGYLGNTPAVARASYIDPRVIRCYENGHTIAAALGDLGQDSEFGDLATRGRAERAVLKLLAGPA